MAIRLSVQCQNAEDLKHAADLQGDARQLLVSTVTIDAVGEKLVWAYDPLKLLAASVKASSSTVTCCSAQTLSSSR